jgi:hypothetical protein
LGKHVDLQEQRLMILVHTRLDELLSQYQSQLGKQYVAYRNHLYRLINSIQATTKLTEIELEKIAIAAAFHDLGLWTHHTLDYLDPSAQMATEYLISVDKKSWIDEVVAMIQDHHKIQASHHTSRIVELFRQADWAEVTFGAVGLKVDKLVMQDIKKHFPNAGFHRFLLKRGAVWGLKHPLNPMPIFKW